MNTEITSSKKHLPLFTRFIINDNETKQYRSAGETILRPNY